MEKLLWFLVYVVVPLVLALGLIMSFIISDWTVFLISLVGTMIIMFQIGYGYGKTR